MEAKDASELGTDEFSGLEIGPANDAIASLTEAFADRHTKGYNWNNLMLQKWVDHKDVEHRVVDDYQRNRMLIDLRCQPDHIRELINETIAANSVPKEVSQVGIRMLKFCQSYDMKKMMDSIQSFAEPFQARYIGE